MNHRVIDGKLLKQMFLHAASTLDAQKDSVNALNVFPVPDGDTGTNMSMTMASAVREVERSKDRTASEVAAAVAQGSLMGARGNSGVILSQLFRGFAKGCEGHITLDSKVFAQAFQEGVETAYKAVMKPVEGTILTVARESAAAGVQAARRQNDPVKLMKLILDAAEASLVRTPELLPVLKKAGVVDSGGKGLCVIMRGYYEVMAAQDGLVSIPDAEQEIKSLPADTVYHDISPATHIEFAVDEEISHIQFPYDTELFIRRRKDGPAIPMEEVQQRLEPMGDSIYVVGSPDLAKLHIHAENPGPVLSLCYEYGDLIDIVIHNMQQQHEDLLEHAARAPENQTQAAPAAPEVPEYDPNATAVVAVGVGEGIEAIFRSLGAAEVIQGGQTMNPSTQDLLEAIESCASQQVFVLPNNKNIILAAEQAAALTDKKVYVIPSRSVPQGIAALIAWMPDGEGEKVNQAMVRALDGVQTGEITYSVRDTVFGEITIKEGDILGLWNGQIKVTGQAPEEVLYQLVEQMVAENGGEVITVYWGEGVEEAQAEAVGASLRQRFPDHEVEIQFGGQPLYFYIFSLE